MKLKSKISRRDFLKIFSLAFSPLLVQPIIEPISGYFEDAPNIIILVFDAWSANDVSLYGYPRQTMPNLEAFAENAIVYHHHYSAGTFTIPGTASLLTGMVPWTHRALSLGSGVLRQYESNQAFALLSKKYATLGYAQNKYADIFLKQFRENVDQHVSGSAFNFNDRTFYAPLFENDAQIAFSTFDDNLVRDSTGYDASLFLGPLLRTMNLANRREIELTRRLGYPHGLPETDAREYFSLKDIVDGVIDLLRDVQSPTFAYLHFYPPHDPYRPTKRFNGSFLGKDAWEPDEKPIHRLATLQKDIGDLRSKRHVYDDYLASWDYEISRLFAFLHESGLLKNSYLFVTSDHGEMFERGELGHVTPLIYEPLIHIPLLVSCPGQVGRQDVYSYTSSVDILPTLASIAGLPIPDWTEGEPLPYLGGVENNNRGLYTVEAAHNSAFKPLERASIALTRNQLRLIYYNYPGDQQFEFYNLAEDPEELTDLYPFQPVEAMQMQDELLQALAEKDRRFLGK